MEFAVKPQEKAFEIAFQMAGVEDSSHCLLFDDLMPNLLAARSIGMGTALVGENGRTQGVDFHLPSIHDIKELMPQLWSGR
jgi:FMN phosphatase YigB (HAD superfamily)